MISKIKNILLDLFFPSRCAICDDIVTERGSVCSKCAPKVRFLTDPVCMVCGKKVEEGKVYCYDCTRKKHAFIRNYAVFVYADIRESLYRFKYNGRAEYAEYYAKAAYRCLGRQLSGLGAQALVPIPLHPSKKRKRGYNQAEEFASELSKLSGIPVYMDLVKRKKKTKPLKTLNVSERQNNLKKAFLFMQNDVKLDTIILIDDIYTTGATLDAVAAVCHEAGIARVYGLTVAVGTGL